ncbi:hypothetical protein [Rhizobium binxianense]|uniref:hypothetical protein n=1 Tax=Rhizobium binxianense TaxID=3024242 RepID=UPI0023A9B98B|nr:hypothetical protein [Rhizobium sp. MJ22]WEA24055.1 hypothetical protein PO862_13145 [Rhizobium sp. MJ22]
MSMFLGHLGLALIVGAFFLCLAAAVLAALNSGDISREEEVERYRVRHPANSN